MIGEANDFCKRPLLSNIENFNQSTIKNYGEVEHRLNIRRASSVGYKPVREQFSNGGLLSMLRDFFFVITRVEDPDSCPDFEGRAASP